MMLQRMPRRHQQFIFDIFLYSFHGFLVILPISLYGLLVIEDWKIGRKVG